MIRCNRGKCASAPEPGRKKCAEHLAEAVAYANAYRERNREVLAEKQRLYNNRWQEKTRNSRLRRVYGITLDEYAAMFEAQGGVCAICKSPEYVGGNRTDIKNLAVDHCHETNKVRGLLCNNCNRATGLFRDDVEYMRKAIEYLEGA